MTAWGWKKWLAVAVVAIMAVGSLGLVGLVHPGFGAPSSSAGVSASAARAGSSSAASAAKAPSDQSHSTAAPIANAGSSAAARALAATKAAGISPNHVFVPRPSASAAQIQASQSQGYVTPLYSSTPAPVGLAEYGLMNNSLGAVTPFILNTTSVQATFDPSANGGPNATDLADSSPDGYGVQLNAVVTNITLFGTPGYSFWTQNVVEYYPFLGEIYLITNVWNFSSPAVFLSSNVFYAHGPLGHQVGNTYYYSFDGPFSISYPFNMTFTMLSNITSGRNSVYFSLTATNSTGATVINATDYDYVIFNSTASGGAPLTVPSNYTANGFTYNPLGLTDDFELTIGGPGGGSQTTFLTANATETLSYWDATTDSYQAVPSAYSYGGETGETSVGASMSWTTGSTGQPVGLMSTGPSLLGGLWNASSPAGGPGTVTLNTQPGNAFVIVSYAGTSSTAFNITEPELAPTVTTNVLTLPAGTYNITIALSDYDAALYSGLVIAPGSATTLTTNLAWDPTTGVYTPLWAWSNEQVGNLSTSGSGTFASPYVIVNNQVSQLGFGQLFGELNDYGFPVWPGVYFLGTTAYTEFASPPSLAVNTSTQHIGPNALPTSNNLPYWFYDDSNIAIVNATDITGWFSGHAYDYPYFLTFNVEFWNSTNLLIANDTFNTESQALLLYNGYSSTNPDAIGNSVIWGNTFLQATPPSPSAELVPYYLGIGLSEQENGDTIYNNYFATPTTAVSYPEDLYYGYLAAYFDTWNITPTAASAVYYDSNWPAFALTGSIIGTAMQGGNYWWDYGLSISPYAFLGVYTNSNPYTTLPYTESGWIDYWSFLGPSYVSGDYAPLLYSALYTVNLTTPMVPGGISWGYTIWNTTDPAAIYWEGTVSGPSASFVLPNGVYNYTVTPPAGYAALPGATGSFVVDNANVTFTPTMAPGGLAAVDLWAVYNSRPDLQAAFPDAFSNLTNYSLLVNWAGGVVTGAFSDSANTTLAPFGYYYALMYIYDGRSDLQSAFPQAFANFTNFSLLGNWAGGVVTGAFADSDQSTLAPFGYYYDLMYVYDGRSDLQAAFPDAFTNFAEYTLLVNWAGGVVTNSFVDSNSATLLPYGYYYALMYVYDGRSDLQAAFPNAFTNGANYQLLLVWANDVVKQIFVDSDYTTLLPFAASYEALG